MNTICIVKLCFCTPPPPGDVVTWLSGRLASLFSQPSLLIAFQICYIFKYSTFQILEFSNDFSFLRLSFYIKGSHHLQGSERSLHNVVRSQGNTQHISYRRERFPLSHRLRNTQNIQLLDLIRFIFRIHSITSWKMTLEC